MPRAAPRSASVDPAAPVLPEPPATVATTPEPAAESESHVLDVRVTDANGQPVAGARVQAVSCDGGEIRTAVTSQDGGACFVGLRENAHAMLVRAEARDGRVTKWTDSDASLVLQPGALLSGDVVEAASGSPVGDALVSIEEGGTTDEMATSAWPSVPAFASVATNAQGAFGPVAVPRDVVVTVIARAANHANLRRSVAIRGAGDVAPLRLEMEAGGVVVGVVRAPDGKPVAGAHVAAVFGQDKDSTNRTALGPVPLTDYWCICAEVADVDGRYRIDRLPLGVPYAVFAWAEGWATSAPVDDLVVAEAHSPATADLVLRRLGRLDILVRDPEGRPVAGARVGEVHYSSKTSEDPVPAGPAPGTYRLDEHFPGEVSLHVVATGLAPVVAVAEIGEGDAREISVHLVPAVAIHGVVLDDRGLPVEGATLKWYAEGQLVSDRDDDTPIVTGPDGKFEIPGLAVGPHEVGAEKDGAWMPDDGPLIASAPAEGVVVRLVPVGRFGQIRLRLRVPPGGSVPQTLSYHQEVHDWNGGEFTLEHCSPGPGHLRLFPPGYSTVTLDYSVAAGETTDLGEILLDEGVVLRGRVADPSGKAVEGATVTLVQNEAMDDPQVSTSADGGFEIPHGERGANRLSVARDGFVRGEFTVPGDGATTGPALVLRPGGLLRARVVDSAGRPAPSVFVSIKASGGATTADDLPRADTDLRGVCEVRLPAGTYGVSVGDAAATQIVLAEGGTADLTLNVR